MKSDPTFWILARAGGFTAYLLLTASIIAGILVRTRPFPRGIKLAGITDLHGFLALLGLGAVAIHGIALFLDSVVEIPVVAFFVPGLVPYRPLWTGVGVVTAELMLLVYLSFSIRTWIGVDNWRRLHYSTYVIFAGATIHGFSSGTDSGLQWSVAVYAAAVGAVVGATVWRVLSPSPSSARARRRSRSPGAEAAAQPQSYVARPPAREAPLEAWR